MSDTQLWRGAVLHASIVAGLSSTVMAFVNGQPGLFGGLLASVTVIIFLVFICWWQEFREIWIQWQPWHLRCFHILQK